MNLHMDPAPTLDVFNQPLECIVYYASGTGAVFAGARNPRPDRHLILGLVQLARMAIEERDAEVFQQVPAWSVTLERDGKVKALQPGLLIIRSTTGAAGVTAPPDHAEARRLARQAERHFTGTVRLDVP